MRALTVRQPWAWAIVHGGKDVENRTRNLAGGYRGPVAIHAAGRYADDWADAAWTIEQITGEAIPPFDCGHASEVLGAFVGVVDLVDVHSCRMLDDGRTGCCDPWGEQEYVDGPRRLGQSPEDAPRFPARVHLVLRDPRPLAQPIPCKGRLGLWTPPADVLDAIREQVANR